MAEKTTTGTGDGGVAHRNDGPGSTVAIISYLLIAQFTLVAGGVFGIIYNRIPVEAVILTVLGGIITAAVAGLATVGGFWLAGAIGNKDDRAALRQLAGAGPPPPADPGAVVETKKDTK